MIEVVTNVLVGIEIVLAAILVLLNLREVHFIERLRPLLQHGEELPLYDTLVFRARYVTAVGVYLLVLTGLAAAGLVIASVFPPIVAINGALLVGLLYGPRQTGIALRRIPRGAPEQKP